MDARSRLYSPLKIVAVAGLAASERHSCDGEHGDGDAPPSITSSLFGDAERDGVKTVCTKGYPMSSYHRTTAPPSPTVPAPRSQAFSATITISLRPSSYPSSSLVFLFCLLRRRNDLLEDSILVAFSVANLSHKIKTRPN